MSKGTIKQYQDDPYKNYLQKTKMVESGGDNNAKAKTSSALGSFQFLEGTWKDVVNKYNLGYTLADRTDPEKAEKVMRLFTQDNEKALKPVLGRNLTDGEKYLGHFLGIGGASNMFKASKKDPNMPVSYYISPKTIEANKGVFYNKDGSVKTTQQVYDWADKKMGGKAANYNISESYPTTPLIDFEVPQISGSFASVPDLPKEETKKEEKPSEALNQLKEEEFLKQYKSLFTQPQENTQQQEVNQPIQTADLQGIFNQVSQFVDGDVAQQGGKKPIYVTDKNDPRYRAYQDSLFVYNNINKFNSGTKEIFNKVKSKEYTYDDALNKYLQLDRDEDIQKLQKITKNKNYKPLEQATQTTTDLNNEPFRRTPYTFKKPTQPVILDEQRPKVQGLNKNINPAGIQSQQELPQGEELPQRTYAKIPKSYDVSSQRYNMQGENPYYNFNAENTDYETALRAKLSAENYNTDIERRYGNEEALKNPKAVERLNQLRQEVSVTPNYQSGGEIEESDLPNPINGIVFKPEGNRTYYDDRIDRIVLTPQSAFAPKQAVINHEKFHKYQFDSGRSNFDIANNTDNSTWVKMQKKPQLPTTDEVYYNFHDRKGRENQIDVDRVKQNETLRFIPDNIVYDKFVERQQYENPYSLEGEATNYERSLYKQSGGKIIKDNNGYWNPDNWGKTVQIDGGDITMKGVNQILEGYSPETGERKLMFPNFDYKFSGAKRVIETPLKGNEIEFLKNIKK